MNDDLRSQHRYAVAEADQLVRRIAPDDLARGTPCGDWTLADLLAHMIGQHRGFAADARTGDAPVSAYDPRAFTLDEWEASVADLLVAFEEADPDGHAVLCEIAPTALPMNRVVSAQLLDTVVHTWDIARSVGEWYEPPAELAGRVAEIARSVPDDARRTRTNSAFAPARRNSGSEWATTLAHLGRDPGPLDEPEVT
jgi:uncharacterized protein (TIGR03086 family)